MRAYAGLVGALLASLTLLGGCGLHLTGHADVPAEHVRAAARAAIAGGGARVTLSARGPARDGYATSRGSGETDLARRAASVRLEIDRLGAVDALTVERKAYGSLPERAIGNLAAGRRWVSVDLDRVDRGLFADTIVQLGSGITGNPADTPLLLTDLRDDARSEGSDQIDGVTATRYRGVIDLADAGRRLPALRGATERYRSEFNTTLLPVLAWVDQAGRLRQVTEVLRPDSVRGGGSSATLTLDAPEPAPPIVAPDAVQVQDLLHEVTRRNP